jgi:4-hydroxymandelate oxidase
MAKLVNVREYEQRARELLPQMAYDYYAGGAGDEITIRENEQAWGDLRLRPRMLVDVRSCDLGTTILGQPVSMPLMTAPCAQNGMAHPDGELAVARATAAIGIIQTLSTVSSYSLEDVAQASHGSRWFQLYCYRDRSITQSLVERAAAAGYTAICVTVDVPQLGNRERDTRNNFVLPAEARVANLAHLLPEVAEGSALQQYIDLQYDAGLTWESLDWLHSITKLPIIVKGILTAEDAILAVQHGVAGIVVSNHGGRQLDTTVSTCYALPEVVAAVAESAEVYVDGGIRRGTDILKALALGARAVLIGRPYLWGLAVGGEAGVTRVLELLRNELRLAMTLAGCTYMNEISHSLIAPMK